MRTVKDDVGEESVASGSPSGNVRTVERALSILAALAAQPGPLGVGDIAPAVNLHPATVHRLLGTLTRLGWVDHPDSARYRLGVRMLGVAALGVAQSPLLSASRDILNKLAEASGWSAYLSVLIGTRVVDLARSPGRLSQVRPTWAFDPGQSHSAFVTADGKLLLAYLPPHERERLITTEPLVRHTDKTILDVDEFRAELNEITSSAFAVDRGERVDFLKGAAAPVFGADGNVTAALLCLGRFDLSEDWTLWLRQEMTLLSQELSHRLKILGE